MQENAAARLAMVDRQVRPSDVTRYGIVEAMLRVPRERFVPSAKRSVAYADEMIEISKGRWLLDPRVFAKMVDTAEIEPQDSVLDIGCGLGYSGAVLSSLCRAVIAVESDEQMASSAEQTLRELSVDNAVVLKGPVEIGAPSEAPFEVILVEGGIAAPPQALFDQLAEGGRLVAIWMDGAMGRAQVSVKTQGTISTRWSFDASAPVLPGFAAQPAFAF